MIDAYRDGIADATGRRVPVTHATRLTQARTVRDAIDSTLPNGSETERLALVRAAAKAAWEDEEHRKAGTPFAWFARNMGKYVSRCAPDQSSPVGLAQERKRLEDEAQAAQAAVAYAPLMDGEKARDRAARAWAALKRFDAMGAA